MRLLLVLALVLPAPSAEARPPVFSGKGGIFSGNNAGIFSFRNDGPGLITPANTVAPVASGTARVGQTLSVTTGTWTGTAPITYTYQWRRDGVNIGSATNSTYVLVTADLGTAIDCNVTATNAAGAVTQDSNNITVGSDLSAVLASAVFDLDATKSASYGGSGTTWANLVTAPADGSAQTAYDFYTGDGSTSTTYPSFNGSAGSAAAYWSFDGGDYFNLKSGTNTAFLKNLHKTTGGQNFWAAWVGRLPNGASTVPLWATQASNTSIGTSVRVSATELITYQQRGDAGNATSTSSGTTASTSTDYIILFSYDHATTTASWWINTLSKTDVAHTPVSTTTDGGLIGIGAYSGGTNPLANTAILYAFAMGNEYLDDTKAAAIIAALEARHGRDYTP